MNLFLKEYETKVPNSNISLQKPVSIIDIHVALLDQVLIRKMEELSFYSCLYFWDFGIKASKYLKIGDTTMIAMQDYLYWGKIDVIVPDETGKIGDAIGWARQFHGPWANVVGYKKIYSEKMNRELKAMITNSIEDSAEIERNFYCFQNIPDLVKHIFQAITEK